MLDAAGLNEFDRCESDFLFLITIQVACCTEQVVINYLLQLKKVAFSRRFP